MFFVIGKDGFIFSSGRDMTYFSRNVHHMVVSENDLLTGSSQDRLLQIYNKNAEIPVRDFASIEDARERVAQLLKNFKLEEIPMAKRNQNAAGEAVVDNVKTDTQAATATTETAKTDGGKGRISKSAVIRLKTDKNPKREGSAAHKRFGFYKDGQTVGEFLDAGGTMGDVNFDQGKGFIALEGVDAPEPAPAATDIAGETQAAAGDAPTGEGTTQTEG